jgi:hypothetical protein
MRACCCRAASCLRFACLPSDDWLQHGFKLLQFTSAYFCFRLTPTWTNDKFRSQWQGCGEENMKLDGVCSWPRVLRRSKQARMQEAEEGMLLRPQNCILMRLDVLGVTPIANASARAAAGSRTCCRWSEEWADAVRMLLRGMAGGCFLENQFTFTCNQIVHIHTYAPNSTGIV